MDHSPLFLNYKRNIQAHCHKLQEKINIIKLVITYYTVTQHKPSVRVDCTCIDFDVSYIFLTATYIFLTATYIFFIS